LGAGATVTANAGATRNFGAGKLNVAVLEEGTDTVVKRERRMRIIGANAAVTDRAVTAKP
jgi:hypothetical protein